MTAAKQADEVNANDRCVAAVLGVRTLTLHLPVSTTTTTMHNHNFTSKLPSYYILPF